MTEPLGGQRRPVPDGAGVPTPVGAPQSTEDDPPTVQSPAEPVPSNLFSAKHSGIFRPGEVLDDRYRMIGRIGKGGMGEVWRARHIGIQKDVAVKILTSDESSPNHEEQAERFMREARASAAIKHRGVADITDFGRTPAGAPYFVMELLEGRNLRKAIKQDGPMSWPKVKRLLEELSGALEAAHALGIVHCDLKPANIFEVRDGDQVHYKLIDFGIAKFTILPENARKITRTGMIHGTPKYMSPEQARGRKLDARADVYALGCVAHFALTGKPPFDGPNIGVLLSKHLKEPPTPPSQSVPGVPEEADRFVLRALRKGLEERYQNMAEVRAGLRGVEPARSAAAPVTMSDAAASSRSTGASKKAAAAVASTTSTTRSSWPRTVIFMGVMVAVGGGVGGVAALQSRAEEPEPTIEAGSNDDAEAAPEAPAAAPTRAPAPAPAAADEPVADEPVADEPVADEREHDTVGEAPAPEATSAESHGGKRRRSGAGKAPAQQAPPPTPEPEPQENADPTWNKPDDGIKDPFK